jgi:hypothetical protein
MIIIWVGKGFWDAYEMVKKGLSNGKVMKASYRRCWETSTLAGIMSGKYEWLEFTGIGEKI